LLVVLVVLMLVLMVVADSDFVYKRTCEALPIAYKVDFGKVALRLCHVMVGLGKRRRKVDHHG
jgi:hypothetical protein